jgi:type III pantothenate kinase
MNLVIDAGNTSLKAGLFLDKQLLQFFPDLNREKLREVATQYAVNNVIVSSVARQQTYNDIFDSKVNLFYLSHELPVPIHVLYHTPHTLGADRLASAAGAHALAPDKPKLVIDAGSCITYDYTDAAGQYYGGSISPGLNMRFKALHTFTARLPLLEKSDNVSLTGYDTATSIQSGITHGIVAEVNGIISSYQEKIPELAIFLCGGDTDFFESKIKAHIFVVPHLVLIGLNSILDYNVSKT